MTSKIVNTLSLRRRAQEWGDESEPASEQASQLQLQLQRQLQLQLQANTAGWAWHRNAHVIHRHGSRQ